MRVLTVLSQDNCSYHDHMTLIKIGSANIFDNYKKTKWQTFSIQVPYLKITEINTNM